MPDVVSFQIRKKSQANDLGLQEGDSLISINGVSTRGKSHEEAMELIDSGGTRLTLELIRSNLNAPEVGNAPLSFGSYVNGHSTPTQPTYPTSSSSFQSFSTGNTQNSVQTDIYRQQDGGRETNTFVRQEQTQTFAPKPWNSTMYQNQIPKPFSPSASFSPAPQVQVSAMYSNAEVKENVPPRRLSLQATSNRTPKYGPRPTSPTGDRMPTLNVWALKEMPKYTRPAPKPVPKRVVEAPPTFPIVPMKKPVPAPAPPPPPPPPPPPEPSHDPHLFAPPVETSLGTPNPRLTDSGYFGSPFTHRPHNLALERTFSLESDISSTSSALGRKKLYGDSAFYNDPDKNFPTIEEQMKLCKAIAQSLTSAANKKARGARMFAKRQKKASNWVHDEVTHGKVSSIGGSDVGNLLDLDSELSFDDGGSKPLFSFRVPAGLKNRINSPESTPKMSLSKDEFERLRLKSSKNEHKNVSPDQCFDLVANLKSGKGRGAKLFEKRQKKAEKWVIDENNAKKQTPVIPQNRLDSMLMSPPKPYLSPWEAASKGEDVNSAFEHLSDFEKQQRLNQILGYKPPTPKVETPAPRSQPIMLTPVSQTSLKTDNTQSLLEGQNFNRVAKGWSGFGSSSANNSVKVSQPMVSEPPPVAPKPSKPVPQRDYNPKPRAWMGSQVAEEENDSSPEPMSYSPSPAVWSPAAYSPADRNMYTPSSHSAYSSGQPSPNFYGQNVSMYNNGYAAHPVELPGSDL
ncbi:hypothetical protein SNE40_019708 [Patella caerulea]|uniref:PDZ domain-containing protein n=1 Tax=Patella caerulea TaxID=87958 RepID=A0AAN8J6W8_PATCE